MATLPPADPEIGAATLRSHLDEYWSNRGLDDRGWTRVDADPLHVVVTMPACRVDGEIDDYFVRLGAEYYDVYPPTVLFVSPDDGWPRARIGTRWWPRINNPTWFQLHDENSYTTGPGQLVCFSFTAEYYLSDHGPETTQRWRQGKHTVAATLSRLAEVLGPPHYVGRDRAD